MYLYHFASTYINTATLNIGPKLLVGASGCFMTSNDANRFFLLCEPEQVAAGNGEHWDCQSPDALPECEDGQV